MPVPIVSFVGRSNSGKTTLIERIIPELVRAGYRVATVKHAGHGFDLDTEGKDSWRHKRAGASSVVVVSKGSLAMFADVSDQLKVEEVRDRFIDAALHRFVVDRGGNATSVILVDGRVAGVWHLLAGRPPELRLCFFDAIGASVRRRVRAVAAEITDFVTGESARISEVDRMTPLTGRSPGRFQSPLSASD